MKNATANETRSLNFAKIHSVAFLLLCLFLTPACADEEPVDEDEADPSINPPITFVDDDDEGPTDEKKDLTFPNFMFGTDSLAFPYAEGYARKVQGARAAGDGIELYRVTNLNTSGEGSLNDAISKENRIIVFAVAGVLDMEKKLYVLKSNQTLLFETAPGDGFVMFNGRISGSGAKNVIVRYARVRQGGAFGTGKDCAGLANGGDQIYDHCSFTWGGDETFSVNSDGKGTRPYNVTLSNSIVGQGRQNHSAGGLMQTSTEDGTTIFRNLLIDNKTRNLKVKGLNQYVNNVVYNWGNGSCYDMGGDSDGDSKTTIVNNYFIKGPGNNWQNVGYEGDDVDAYCAEDPEHRHKKDDHTVVEYSKLSPSKPISGGGGKGEVRTYCTGNWYDYDTDGNLGGVEITQANWSDYCSGTPAEFLGAPDPLHPVIKTQTSAEEAYKYIVEKVGASLPRRDKVDSYLIEELTSLGTKGTIISDERQSYQYPLADTWKDMDTSNNIVDTDEDGMPDDFEDKWGLDKKNAADAVRRASNGYLNIENYAFSLEFPDVYEEQYKKWQEQQ